MRGKTLDEPCDLNGCFKTERSNSARERVKQTRAQNRVSFESFAKAKVRTRACGDNEQNHSAEGLARAQTHSAKELARTVSGA